MDREPIRLLFWTREAYPTYRVDIDTLFGQELIGRGHPIDFVMQADSPEVALGPQPWRGRTVYVGRTATGGVVQRFGRHALALWHDLRSLRLATPESYDAIQVRDKFVFAAIALWVARRRGLKFFYWISFPYPEADRARARLGETRFPFFADLRGIVAGWLLYRWVLPRATHSFVQSEQMKRDFVDLGIDPQGLTAVPMGIDLKDFPQSGYLAARLASSFDAVPVVSYLGALNRDRHIDMLVEMLALLRDQGIRIKLLLVGDGSEPEDRIHLESRAQARNVSADMEITGMLPRDKALGRMRESDIAISAYYPTPVLLSTSPTKLVEYLALGLPVVGSQHPEQRLILRDSGAGVCAPWGARHFARSVRWLLRKNRQELREMGARGRNWVATHRTYSRIADGIEQKYRDMLYSAENRSDGHAKTRKS